MDDQARVEGWHGVTDVREQLFEAHVQHELSLWHGAALEATVAEWVRALFRFCETTKLDDVATPAQILGVIDRYVIELRVSGGITELTGEMSNLVFSSKATANTRLDEVVVPSRSTSSRTRCSRSKACAAS